MCRGCICSKKGRRYVAPSKLHLQVSQKSMDDRSTIADEKLVGIFRSVIMAFTFKGADGASAQTVFQVVSIAFRYPYTGAHT